MRSVKQAWIKQIKMRQKKPWISEDYPHASNKQAKKKINEQKKGAVQWDKLHPVTWQMQEKDERTHN